MLNPATLLFCPIQIVCKSSQNSNSRHFHDDHHHYTLSHRPFSTSKSDIMQIFVKTVAGDGEPPLLRDNPADSDLPLTSNPIQPSP